MNLPGPFLVDIVMRQVVRNTKLLHTRFEGKRRKKKKEKPTALIISKKNENRNREEKDLKRFWNNSF